MEHTWRLAFLLTMVCVGVMFGIVEAGNPVIPGVSLLGQQLGWHNVVEIFPFVGFGLLFGLWASKRGHPLACNFGVWGMVTACVLACSAGSVSFVAVALALYVAPGLAAGLAAVWVAGAAGR
jgi:hypothetical protein